jgi:hypothetical protein
MNTISETSLVGGSAVLLVYFLLFGGMVPGEGTLNGVMDGSQWAGGNGLTWRSALLIVGPCLLLDRMLFNKKA